ncbi:TetR family transcriptional regulator [Nocardia sp. Marseille-Q1738]
MVLDLLASDGYDAVQLRTVASRARVSLARIYKIFPTRDELIVSALQQWMTDHAYAEVAPPSPGETVRELMMRVLRCVFEPWERNPRMLEAYHYARSGPGGQRLDEQGLSAMLPIAEMGLRDVDPDYIEDVAIILSNMVVALIGRFATGTLAITEILPILERTVYRLTADNESAASRRMTAEPVSPERLGESLAKSRTYLGRMRADGG